MSPNAFFRFRNHLANGETMVSDTGSGWVFRGSTAGHGDVPRDRNVYQSVFPCISHISIHILHSSSIANMIPPYISLYHRMFFETTPLAFQVIVPQWAPAKVTPGHFSCIICRTVWGFKSDSGQDPVQILTWLWQMACWQMIYIDLPVHTCSKWCVSIVMLVYWRV